MEDRCFLETTVREQTPDYLRNYTKHYSDLGFIGEAEQEEDYPVFDPSQSVAENALKFVQELDAYSICHCTDLFKEEAVDKIISDVEGNTQSDL